MKTIFLFLISISGIECLSQSCDTGKLNSQTAANLLKIGDLQPRLNVISIEQAKEQALSNELTFPKSDVYEVKITRDSISVYVFNASHGKDLPIILYFHPGGFVTPFLPFMKQECWKMSKDHHAIVFAVDYRIAPEHKFPAAVNDAYNAFEWLLDNGRTHGGDTDRLIVSGMSAGGNLAAVVCHKAKNKGLGSKIKLQILNCPSVDNVHHQYKYASYDKYAIKYFQTRAFVTFAQRTYCDEGDFNNPDFAPILAKDFTGLPPTVMITTEFDILRDEDIAYVNKLAGAGVKVWHHCFQGQIHCLVGASPESDDFVILTDLINRAIAEAL